ncbi:hypothetical protein M3643_12685, partial [Staphylococcus lugdunensis]|nr:hypothetical protein [Staphylococcus lugdunensis]
AVGSFYEYARLAFGNWRGPGRMAGFLTGWMYWYFWVIVVALEAVAGARLIQFWLPDTPAWIISLALLVVLTLVPLVARIRSEEALLRSQFGAEYDAYCARTWRLLPGVY